MSRVSDELKPTFQRLTLVSIARVNVRNYQKSLIHIIVGAVDAVSLIAHCVTRGLSEILHSPLPPYVQYPVNVEHDVLPVS
jgi:hypothetical protein